MQKKNTKKNKEKKEEKNKSNQIKTKNPKTAIKINRKLKK